MDTISDMLIRIKNAQAVKKEAVEVVYSDLKMEIANLLKENGFIKEAAKKGKRTKRVIDIVLAYGEDGRGRISGLERVSKQSKRVYAPVSSLKPVKGGEGMAVISTSKGLMTDKEARQKRVGGEVFFKIW